MAVSLETAWSGRFQQKIVTDFTFRDNWGLIHRCAAVTGQSLFHRLGSENLLPSRIRFVFWIRKAV